MHHHHTGTSYRTKDETSTEVQGNRMATKKQQRALLLPGEY